MAPSDNSSKGDNGSLDIATLLLHADDDFATVVDRGVAPSISVSSSEARPSFRSIQGAELTSYDLYNPSAHAYSRYTSPISTRVERVLGALCKGYALTYASGLAAGYAALVFFKPKRIAITAGYHGFHLTIKAYQKARGASDPLEVIGLDDAYKPGDLVWLETPLNPTGELRDTKAYADKAHAVGAKIVVDSTFAPPPLQDPFQWGADCVMHSGTKYLGGHSDLLCGVLVVKTREQWDELQADRTFLGNILGSLESFLLLRSLRTFHLRIPRQFETAAKLAEWIGRLTRIPIGEEWDGVPGGVVVRVWYPGVSEDKEQAELLKTRFNGKGPACFSIMMANRDYGNLLPHAVKCFTPATSLGGVESLIEQRSTSHPGADPRLIRLSIGVEALEDLKEDLRRGFRAAFKGVEKAKM
ncbi:hypothetical protein BOTBODRAFT_151239 [Botryobasidium botryosum FD-172 SS1]|uniref:Cystathionine gamma-synthase n=1 Tax=Botryobasidium botryosum (strain FD-172 SS1) TaxID=930990 RepID=A0A067N9P9_BOTB1|nr:hypothetical protein BOTBODRAFT_151239 [Botryobasidium botryosum FD-172 SS1]